MKRVFILFLLTTVLLRCNIGAGTLGSFDDRKFQIDKSEFLAAFDSLTEREIPDKWKGTASGIEKTYESFENTCLYLKDSPEEMYFVSYKGNSKVTVISVRSVFKQGRWFVKGDLGDDEIDRVETRFDNEIVKKIEDATGTKAERED